MKKTLALLLALLLVMPLVACGDKGNAYDDNNAVNPDDDAQSTVQPTTTTPPENEENELLPYSLQFGMSNDDAKNACQGFPEINNSQSNNGYFSERFSPESEDYWEFFGIDSENLYSGGALIVDPAYYFSFNESKQLYEFYVITKIYDSERAAEVLFNEYFDYYNEKINVEAEVSESDTEISARFETKTLRISVVLEIENDVYTVYTVIHNKTYELSS